MTMRLTAFAVGATALGLAAGCGGNGGGTTQARPASALPRGSELVELDPAGFSTQIDNRYWPMVPGTRWTYREVDAQGNEARVVVTVSTETKRIANGITARIVRDTVTDNGRVIEDTFDWYAQDDKGNIWYLGEDTAELENGKVTTRSGSFEAGVNGALAGVIMPAHPTAGMRYRQEYYKGEAEDNGEVLSTDEQAGVPAGHFRNAVLTKDTATTEPKVLEYKLYARGVGPVLTLDASPASGREELLDVEKVSRQAAKSAGTTPLGHAYP